MASAFNRPRIDAEDADRFDPVDQLVDELIAAVDDLRRGSFIANIRRAPRQVQDAVLADLRGVMRQLAEILYIDNVQRKFEAH